MFSYPHRTDQLLKVTGAAIDPFDTESISERILRLLWYNIFGTNDAREELGGQPFDNHWRLYSGSDNELLLNLRGERFKAGMAVVADISNHYQMSGRPGNPLATIALLEFRDLLRRHMSSS